MAFPPGTEVELTGEDVEHGGTQAKQESRTSVDAVLTCFELGFEYVGDFIFSVRDVWHCGHIPEGVRKKLAKFIDETWPVIQATSKMMDELEDVLEPLITSKHQIAQIFEKTDDRPLMLAIRTARARDQEVSLKVIKEKMLELADLIQRWTDVQDNLRKISEETSELLPDMKQAADKFKACHNKCGLVIIAGTITVTGLLIWSGAFGDLPQHAMALVAAYPGRSAFTALVAGYGYFTMTDEASRQTVNLISDIIKLEKNADHAYQEMGQRVADLRALYAAVEDMVNRTEGVQNLVKTSHRSEQVITGIRGDFMAELRTGGDDESVEHVLAMMEKPEVREKLAGMAQDDLAKCSQIEETIAAWKKETRKVRTDFIALQHEVAKMTAHKDD